MKLKKKKITCRRKFDRFKVKRTRNFKAKIQEGVDRNSTLQSISVGGCSFLSRRTDARLLLNPKVNVTIEIGTRRFNLPGVVHYCQFQPHLGIDSNLVGIEFSWPNAETRRELEQTISMAQSQGVLEPLADIEV